MASSDAISERCDQEPIHAPGGIQPHGALLVLRPDTLTVAAASRNCAAVLGTAADDLIERPIHEVLGPAVADALRDAGTSAEPRPLGPTVPGADGSALHAAAHRRGGTVIIELEPAGGPPTPGWDAAAAASGAAHRLDLTRSLDGLARAICAEFRDLIGYDRVMVYRFEPDWNGTVIAEECRPDQEPYLGLYYPEGDIPAQARRLYLEARVRVIPDTGYEPVPLVPAGRSTDLGRTALRSVSPNCLEFMRNMGVAASFGASLVVHGQLWGMVIGHHRTPRPIPPAVRLACDLLGRLAALQLTSRLNDEEAAGREVGRRLADLALPALTEGLAARGRELAAMVEAAGVAVCRAGRVTTTGQVPAEDVIRRILAWVLARADGPVFSTDRLAEDFPPAASHTSTAAGLLALTVTRDPDLVVLWFRPRVPRRLRWGGNPEKPTAPSLTGFGVRPRTSFAPWEQIVSDRSAPWTPGNADAALHLRQVALLAEARRATRLAQRAAASDTLFRTAFESSGAGLVLCSPAGEIARVNPAFALWLGYDPDELTGRQYPDLVHPDDRVVGSSSRQQLVDGTLASYQVAKRFRHRFGRTAFALVSGALVRSPEGDPEYFVIQVQDVSERTWAERLLAAENRVAALLAAQPTRADLPAPLLAALGDALGYDRADCWEASAGGALRLTHTWTRPGVPNPPPDETIAARTRAGGQPVIDAGTMAVPVACGGSAAGVLTLTGPGPEAVPDGPGLQAFARSLAGTLGRYLDHQAAEDALRASEARFHAFLDHLPHPAWVKDEAGRYVIANPAFAAQYQPSQPVVVQRTDAQLFPPPLADALRRNDRGVVAAGRPLSTTVEVPGPDGVRTYFLVKFPFPGPGSRWSVGGVAVDVTDRIAAERQAVAATRLMRTIIDSAAGPISARDRNLRYLLMNKFEAARYGTAPEAVAGKTAGELLGPEAGRRAAARDLEAITTGLPITTEETTTGPDGRARTWLTTTTPLPGGAGEPAVVGAVHVAVEITDRKAAEDALRRQTRQLEEQHHLAALRAEVGLAVNADAPLRDILRAGCDAVLVHTGAAFVRLWTLNEADNVLELQASVGLYTHTDGPHARIRVGEYKIGRIAETRREHLTNDLPNDPNASDPDWVRREGMAAFAGHPLVCGDRLIGVLALFARTPLSPAVLDALKSTADILALGTARKWTEDALRVSEDQARTLLRTAPMIVFACDEAGRPTLANERWFEYTGLPGTAAAGSWHDLVHPDDVRAALRAWNAAVDTGEPFEAEYRMRRADGAYRWHQTRALPIMNAAGMADQWLGTSADVDDLKAAVRAMDDARAAADAANRAKTEFLANVSHELRTPLGGVLGMAELMLMETLPPVQRERLTVIQSSAERFKGLVNDLLDVARIDAGKMEIAAVPFDPRAVVRAALAPLEFQAKRKGLGVEMGFAPEVPRAVVGDPHRLAQVAVNLFGNAVKFTDRGRVGAAVGCRPAEGGRAVLTVEVRDTGVGIPADKLTAVFEPFTQADPGVARRFGGTGLGLTIARRLIDLMGGTMVVRSTVGLGTIFVCDIPVGVADALPADAAGPPPPANRPLSVLLADDQPINLRVIGDVLRKVGHRVTTATDGAEVVEAVKRERFDVVLMDLQMPGTDGFRAAALIRAREAGTGRRLPIIALTARATPGDRDECLRAGMDEFVTKPVEWAALLRAVAAVTKSWPADPVGPAPATAGSADHVWGLLQRFGNDPGLLAEVIDLFTADAPGLAAELRRAVETDNPAAAAHAAHKLVNLAGTLDAAAVVGAAREIEDMGRRGSLDRAAEELAGLEAALAAFTASLDDIRNRNPAPGP